ncbi:MULTISPECIES: hypothetical protein [Streptomyces]|uniref:Uncharacterized protein n=1 Tax=Streptomyces canarius TaxID=285453 RepID=A0ABQ3DCB3_9ACTN|nr:hypothetical protein [Streptomyces canarius]GHA75626.1 hypothetical protein GCM10010345_92270 [Streptomyces canarius]
MHQYTEDALASGSVDSSLDEFDRLEIDRLQGRDATVETLA